MATDEHSYILFPEAERGNGWSGLWPEIAFVPLCCRQHGGEHAVWVQFLRNLCYRELNWSRR